MFEPQTAVFSEIRSAVMEVPVYENTDTGISLQTEHNCAAWGIIWLFNASMIIC